MPRRPSGRAAPGCVVHPVLVHLQAERFRAGTQGGVVLLRSGEMLQGGRPRGGGTTRKSTCRPAWRIGHLGGPRADQAVGIGERGEERLDVRFGPFAGRYEEDVDVLEHVLAAPQAARDVHAGEEAARPARLGEPSADCERVAEEPLAGRGLQELDRLEDVRLGFFAESLDPGDTAVAAGGLEGLDRRHAQPLVHRLHALRSHARQGQQVGDARGKRRLQRRELRGGARGEQLADDLLGPLADALHLGEPILRREVREAFRQLFDGPRDRLERACLERIRAREVAEHGYLAQHGGDVAIVHGRGQSIARTVAVAIRRIPAIRSGAWPGRT